MFLIYMFHLAKCLNGTLASVGKVVRFGGGIALIAITCKFFLIFQVGIAVVYFFNVVAYQG